MKVGALCCASVFVRFVLANGNIKRKGETVVSGRVDDNLSGMSVLCI